MHEVLGLGAMHQVLLELQPSTGSWWRIVLDRAQAACIANCITYHCLHIMHNKTRCVGHSIT